MKWIKWLFRKRNCRKQAETALNKAAVIISCDTQKPILATNIYYDSGRIRRYVNFTCPDCKTTQHHAVWSDLEHIDPSMYNCTKCDRLLQIDKKEHTIKENNLVARLAFTKSN